MCSELIRLHITGPKDASAPKPAPERNAANGNNVPPEASIVAELLTIIAFAMNTHVSFRNRSRSIRGPISNRPPTFEKNKTELILELYLSYPAATTKLEILDNHTSEVPHVTTLTLPAMTKKSKVLTICRNGFCSNSTLPLKPEGVEPGRIDPNVTRSIAPRTPAVISAHSTFGAKKP